MRTIAAALLAASAYAGSATYANKVCIANQAGFVLDWWVADLITGTNGADSPSYPIDQTKCMDISVSGLNEGDFLEVYVHAHVGATKTASSAVIYQSSPAITASYTCKGTTFSFSCNLNGQAYLEQLEMHGMHAELEAFAAAEGITYTPKFLQ